jgi:hypothetical protein
MEEQQDLKIYKSRPIITRPSRDLKGSLRFQSGKFFNIFLTHTTKIRIWKCVIHIIYWTQRKRSFWRNDKETWGCFLIKSERLVNMKPNIMFGNTCGRRIWGELHTGLWLANFMEWDNLESLGVYGRIILKWTFNKNMGVCKGAWLRRRNQLFELKIFEKR